MKTRKKLIEVALPLEAINKAAKEEKAVPRRGHPQTLHYWWARRPLAAARAVIFSQMVDDPSEYVEELLSDPTTRRQAENSFRLQAKEWASFKIAYDKAHAAGMSATSNPDPGSQPTLEETAAMLERQRLFGILEKLVRWENTTNEGVLQAAREEIQKSWLRTCKDNEDNSRAKENFDPHKLPNFHDPFSGGGALPLEAQRLGLVSYASDLNPVAVLINKAMIEIPHKFAGQSPIYPEARKQKSLLASEWHGLQGLADDVRYFGQWIHDEAEKRIGNLYPKVEVTTEMAVERPDLEPYIGKKLTVIAYFWARTVKSPNPAFAQVNVPLVSTFILSLSADKDVYAEPVIEEGDYRFIVKVGKPGEGEHVKKGTKLTRANFHCVMSGSPIAGDYIKYEAKAGRMGVRMMAIVAEGLHGRLYLPPTHEIENIANQIKPNWLPDNELLGKCRDQLPLYGIDTFSDLFNSRQLVALTTFTDLVQEVRERVRQVAISAGLTDDGISLSSGGTGAVAYADAISVYLGCALSRLASYNNTICHWNIIGGSVAQIFSRQAIPMSWDFIEISPLQKMSGNWMGGVEWVSDVFSNIEVSMHPGFSYQLDASQQVLSRNCIVSTDPPYYDNINYADLSDFFYVWLRHALQPIFPELFSTMAVPKSEELVASPYRHSSKEKAETFFLDGMTHAMNRLAEQAHPAFPVTIYYAFKQSESEIDVGTASTGWETFLDAVINAGFAISGTWPIRTEKQGRMASFETNALASSIVLVCRRRSNDAPIATRREFIDTLNNELPTALAHLQAGNIAPVDLAQAAIGPGMSIFTRYSKVLDAEGKPLSVRHALSLINEILDVALAKQEGDFDADTRWALTWFEQSGFTEGEFGTAETLSKAKDTSVAGMVEAGIVASGRGKVRLLKPSELPDNWDPATDWRLTAWEMVHQLIRALETGGESEAAQMMTKLGGKAEIARELCYRLYTMCERRKRAPEAQSYNALVQSWPEILHLAREIKAEGETQPSLF